ncbi:alpha/beta fold hydrolase [Luteolibacter ambystomatis]|uniref:Alpha/beta fold hydrolase n=1 Tax=Luteolibacter ambystomatis TaxID=2824561 RepID=A0A975J1Y4_9BACT|nr:alpha/beta fold hydrolase [Luteolibacter ambystomatis]QUE52545.1 alpha/beta fold hydrolase [Luteolibacter ambystomatis]
MIKFIRRAAITSTLLLLVAFGGLAVWGSDRLLHPNRRPLQDYHREILSQPSEFGLRVQPYTGPSGTPCLLVTPSPDPGTANKGRIVREELMKRGVTPGRWGDTRGTIVLLHGYCGRKEDNLPIAERFCAAGFRCILPDLPGHGDNPSPTATFGKHETALAGDLVADAAQRFSFPAAPAALFGISQGGAIALQAAGKCDGHWSAVATVAAFSSLSQPVERAATAIPKLAVIAPFASEACSCGVYFREGFTPADIRPVDAATRITIPAFIVHGDQDTFIPISAGRAIYDAIPGNRKTFREVRGGGHGNVLSTGSHALYADLCRFYITSMLGDGKTSRAGIKGR